MNHYLWGSTKSGICHYTRKAQYENKGNLPQLLELVQWLAKVAATVCLYYNTIQKVCVD